MITEASKAELSVTIRNKFQPLTNVKKNSNFYVVGIQDISVQTLKLGKAVKNIGNVRAKIVKKIHF